MRSIPSCLRGTFDLDELNGIVRDDINVIGNLAADTAHGLVTQHSGDMIGRNTILKDEAVLGGNTARVVRFHIDVHDILSMESRGITQTRL